MVKTKDKILAEINKKAEEWFSNHTVSPSVKAVLCHVCGNILKTKDEMLQGFHNYHLKETVEELKAYLDRW